MRDSSQADRYDAGMTAPADDAPTASLLTLQRRAALTTKARGYFQQHGYWEVETPILSQEMILDAWLEPFVAEFLTDASRWQTGGEPRYLQTSPEAHMKRLLAAGADAIYQFSRVFRNGESGRLHNPEFTMLEWYRVGDDHFAQMDFVEALVRMLFEASAEWRSTNDVHLRDAFERLEYDEAFARYAGQRVLDRATVELHGIAADRKLSPPVGLHHNDHDGWLNFLLAELVEPQLGRGRPTFLHAYPPSQAALARTAPLRPGAPETAERFELYLNGVEVCNGYHELTDPAVLKQRMQDQAALRAAAGLRPLPASNRLLEAMQRGLPASCGVALGWDRLAMLCLGLDSITDVIPFPFDRA